MRILNRKRREIREDFLNCIQERLESQIKIIQQSSDEKSSANPYNAYEVPTDW